MNPSKIIINVLENTSIFLTVKAQLHLHLPPSVTVLCHSVYIMYFIHVKPKYISIISVRNINLLDF